MAARRRLRVAPALLALAAVACAQDDGRSFNPLSSFTNVSVAEERATGARADKVIRQHVDAIHDPVVVGFMSELGQGIVDRIEPQPFLYRFRVIEDSSLNAFAVPGGYIYFHSGTILAAGSLDELAGVMAHEIAHVQAHHWARRKERTALPRALAALGGMAAAAATGEPGLAVAAQGMNVALEIQYTREFEAEADDLASSFLARNGYDLDGLAHFFERLLARKRGSPQGSVPPYLYTHPDVESRIRAAERRAEQLSVAGSVDPELRARFRTVQARLAYLVEHEKSRLRTARPAPDRAATDPLLEEAKRRAEAGEREAALEHLREAESMAPGDPSIPYRRGELLEEAGRLNDAVRAWRRALELDSEVALVWMRLGLAYKALGERHAAAFYLEQALSRAESGGRLARRSEHALELLTFPPLTGAGLAAGAEAASAESAAGGGHEGFSAERFEAGGPAPVWWGRVAERYERQIERMRVRWIGPSGETLHESAVETAEERRVLAALEPSALSEGGAGRWQVEARLDGAVIDRRRFRLLAADSARSAAPGSDS